MSQALSKTVGCSLLPKQDTCNHKHPALPAGDDDPWSCMCIIAKAFFCFGRDRPIVQGTPWWLPAWIASPAKAEALPSEGASALDIAKAPTQAHSTDPLPCAVKQTTTFQCIHQPALSACTCQQGPKQHLITASAARHMLPHGGTQGMICTTQISDPSSPLHLFCRHRHSHAEQGPWPVVN